MQQRKPAVKAPQKAGELVELAWLFLKLGTTAFGGPAAHIALMEDEVVRRRNWLTHAEFLDLLGATNLIPGPNSTEMAIHIGRLRAGWPGLAVSGVCFILPAALIVTAIAWGYLRFGRLPKVEGLLYGVKPVIIAVVLQALWTLGKAAIKTKPLAVAAVTATIAAALGVHELLILLATGLLVGIARTATISGTAAGLLSFIPLLLPTGAVGTTATGTSAPFGLWPLFLFFLKIGSVLYGSGYVLLAFLRADLVERWNWISETQLLDAVAIGQFTPGPVFTTATFIGFILAGGWGATLATVGIFLPAFLLVAVSGPLIPWLRRSQFMSSVLDGINVASLGLMALVTCQLARVAIYDWVTVSLLILSGSLLVRYRVNSAWLVAGGALVGLAVKWP